MGCITIMNGGLLEVSREMGIRESQAIQKAGVRGVAVAPPAL